MKYYTFLILIIAFISCKKNYNCECTSTLTMPNNGYVTVNKSNTELKKVSKKRAKELCIDSYKYSQVLTQITEETIDCELK